MIRLPIELPETMHNRLRQVARKQDRSLADCIREAVDLFLGKYGSQPSSIDAIAGKYSPQPMSGLKRHDRWWAEAIMAKCRRDSR